MKRYLIKVTYAEGIHTGESCLMRKGGYTTSEDNIEWNSTTYKTKAIAERACKRLYEDNELSRKCERETEELRVKRGFAPKKFYIYESCAYEPYAVDALED